METTDARIRAIRDWFLHDGTDTVCAAAEPEYFNAGEGNTCRRCGFPESSHVIRDLLARLGEVETALSGAQQQLKQYEEQAVTRGDKGVGCSAAGSTAASNGAKQ